MGDGGSAAGAGGKEGGLGLRGAVDLRKDMIPRRYRKAIADC